MYKAHTGDAYCIAAASAMYQVTWTTCLSDDWAWFRVASQMSIGPLKHYIAGFPATCRRRHEYYISVFHKPHYNLLSHNELTPRLTALMRASKPNLSAVVAYSGTRMECQNGSQGGGKFWRWIQSGQWVTFQNGEGEKLHTNCSRSHFISTWLTGVGGLKFQGS